MYCGDDEDCRKAFESFQKKSISYGFGEENEFCIRDFGKQLFQVSHKGDVLGEFKAPLPGNHNALNALAAMVVALRAGIDFESIKEGIESFTGVRRRFEVKADLEQRDLLILDDYAHHPTEIVATLSACKKRFLGCRIRCVFQPHRYSRLKTCWDQFKNAFDMADELYLTEVYPAGEKPIEGFESKDLLKNVTNSKVFMADGDFKDVSANLIESSKAGDVIITLGAGDVYKISDLLAESLTH